MQLSPAELLFLKGVWAFSATGLFCVPWYFGIESPGTIGL
jgi:hypothetical protein